MSRTDRLDDLRQAIARAEPDLAGRPFVEVARHDRNGRATVVCLTERLRRHAAKEEVWRSRPFLATLDNARYGFDRTRQRSLGGRDGIYRLGRSHVPANAMMTRIFDRYLATAPTPGRSRSPARSGRTPKRWSRCAWSATTSGSSA